MQSMIYRSCDHNIINIKLNLFNFFSLLLQDLLIVKTLINENYYKYF